MKTSDSTSKIAAALAEAQGHLEAVAKDKSNPAYKSKFASLDAIIESVRGHLSDAKIAIVQSGANPLFVEGTLRAFTVETRLLHESGEWIESDVTVPVAKADPQGVGSAMTYARRYAISAILVLAVDEDDDGNAASKQPAKQRTAKPAPEETPQRAAGLHPYAIPFDGFAADRTVKGVRLGDMPKADIERLKGWAADKGYLPLVKECNTVLTDLALGAPRSDDTAVAKMKADVDKEESTLPFK